MRIVVMSDSHTRLDLVHQVIERHLAEADLFVHLGDGVSEFKQVQGQYPQKQFLCVQGNCDLSSSDPVTNLLVANSVRILYTHGHRFYVKNTMEHLKEAAKVAKAKVVLYGHTHYQQFEYDDGLYIFNPGSLGMPREDYRPNYGILDLETKSDSIVCSRRWL